MIRKIILFFIMYMAASVVYAQLKQPSSSLSKGGDVVFVTAESALLALKSELVADNTTYNGASISIKSLELLRGIADKYPNKLESLVQLVGKFSGSAARRAILLRELAYYTNSHPYLIQYVVDKLKLADVSNAKKDEIVAALAIANAVVSSQNTVAYELYDLIVHIISDSEVNELLLAAINELNIWSIAPTSRIKLHKVIQKRIDGLQKKHNDSDLINNNSLILLGLHRLKCQFDPSFENQQKLVKVLSDSLDDQYARFAIFAITQCGYQLTHGAISWLLKVAEYGSLSIETKTLAATVIQQRTNNDKVFEEATEIKKAIILD